MICATQHSGSEPLRLSAVILRHLRNEKKTSSKRTSPSDLGVPSCQRLESTGRSSDRRNPATDAIGTPSPVVSGLSEVQAMIIFLGHAHLRQWISETRAVHFTEIPNLIFRAAPVLLGSCHGMQGPGGLGRCRCLVLTTASAAAGTRRSARGPCISSARFAPARCYVVNLGIAKQTCCRFLRYVQMYSMCRTLSSSITVYVSVALHPSAGEKPACDRG